MTKYDTLHLKEEEVETRLKTQIGNVKLDYSCYPGQDLYCDGDVEDEILSTVKKYSKVEYSAIIEEKKNWPILYHLSELRSNIVDWIPMKKDAKVLELGAGCGAITGKLAKKAGSVTCVDLSAKRSHINAYRNQDADNITIHVGNFKDILPHLPHDYDYICLIGAFEYAYGYIGGETPYESLLRAISPHLADGGRIIIAIENKFGMKYFAGCKEDHLGSYFSGIENYRQESGVRTFTKSGLEGQLKGAGMEEYSFYYPYPDYKFMTTLYSDKRLPMDGELSDNDRNFDRDRMKVFNEKYAFDAAIEEGMFPHFSNSYCLVIGPDLDISYAKYSNDRDLPFAIKTELIKAKDGKKIIRKSPLSDEAKGHIEKLEKSYHELSKRYEGSPLQINKCRLVGKQDDNIDLTGAQPSCAELPYAEFEYVEGRTLSTIMDECLSKGDDKKIQELFDKYYEYISYGEDKKIADYDIVFSNIIINEDRDEWTLIDYEWTTDERVESKELAFRAVYCYLLEEEKRNELNLDLIMDKLKITPGMAEEYREKEKKFQHSVTGKKKSMGELRILLGRHVVEVQPLVDKFISNIRNEQVQIYEDSGSGYSEEESYFYPEPYEQEGRINLEIQVGYHIKMLRIDPGMQSCMVKLEEMKWNGTVIKKNRKTVVTNGKKIKNDCYVFATQDPNININLEGINKGANNKLQVQMEVTKLSEGMAQLLSS